MKISDKKHKLSRLIALLLFFLAAASYSSQTAQAVSSATAPPFERMWGWGVAGGMGFEICFINCDEGVQGVGDGQINNPIAIATASDNHIFLLHSTILVQEFTPDGQFVAQWGDSSTFGEGGVFTGGGIAIDKDDFIYISDSALNRISKFDRDGNFQLMWGWGVDTGAAAFETCISGCGIGIEGLGDGQFTDPSALAFDADGNIYITDLGSNRIQKLAPDGSFITKWGSTGGGEGQFQGPLGITVSENDIVYVADTFNNRIQRFDSDGNFQLTWGFGVEDGSDAFQICETSCQASPRPPGAARNGELEHPKGLVTDADGTVIVTDFHNHRMQNFDADGNFLHWWGGLGSREGEFWFPEYVTIDNLGNLSIADGLNDRVQKFGSIDITDSCTNGVGDTAALLAAVATANALDNDSIISLPESCVYDFTSAQASPLGPSALNVTTPITIDGHGSTIRRDDSSSVAFRLLYVGSSGQLTLNDLVLDKGWALGRNGGNVNGPGGGGGGGGVGGHGATGFRGLPAAGGGGGGNHGNASGNNGGAITGGQGGSDGRETSATGRNGGYGGGGGGGGRKDPGGHGNGNGGHGNFGGGGGGGALHCGNSGGGHGGRGGFGGGGGAGGRGNQPGGAAGPFGSVGRTGENCDHNYSEGGGGGGAAGLGGAIIIDGGAVTINRSTLSNNVAQGGQGGVRAGHGAGLGGAIFMVNGSLSATNSTFTANRASGAGNAQGRGAALFIHNGTATLHYNTISDNENSTDGTVFLWNHASVAGVLHMVGNIVANTTGGADCKATLTTNQFNLTEDGSCATAVSGDPALGALGLHGGLTPNYTLTNGSLARNAAAASCITETGNIDQRYRIRPIGLVCDIGSHEYIPTAVAPTVTITISQLSRSNEMPNCMYNLRDSFLPYEAFDMLVENMGTEPFDITGAIGDVPDYFRVDIDCGLGGTDVSNTVGEFSFEIMPGG
ncbi:MAG: choice-of-anchor Q domain-containing protein [Chloroflexota bacterium]